MSHQFHMHPHMMTNKFLPLFTKYSPAFKMCLNIFIIKNYSNTPEGTERPDFFSPSQAHLLLCYGF